MLELLISFQINSTQLSSSFSLIFTKYNKKMKEKYSKRSLLSWKVNLKLMKLSLLKKSSELDEKTTKTEKKGIKKALRALSITEKRKLKTLLCASRKKRLPRNDLSQLSFEKLCSLSVFSNVFSFWMKRCQMKLRRNE